MENNFSVGSVPGECCYNVLMMGKFMETQLMNVLNLLKVSYYEQSHN